jgi:hypothetical protein
MWVWLIDLHSLTRCRSGERNNNAGLALVECHAVLAAVDRAGQLSECSVNERFTKQY